MREDNHYSEAMKGSEIDTIFTPPEVEVFENSYPDRTYLNTIHIPEFTSVCPKTGQPDYAEIVVTYVPDDKCLELKSLKLYVQSFRNQGVFYEVVVNRIADDLYNACLSKWLRVSVKATPRGGIWSHLVTERGDRKFAEIIENPTT